MFSSVIAAALVYSQVSAYSLCNPTNYPYKGQSLVSIPIKATATKVTPAGDAITVGGSISVIDGCSFSVSGLFFTGPQNATFFGAKTATSDGVDSIRLISNTINATATPFDANYTFITTAGNWASYVDFTQFRLYDPVLKVTIGTADLPSQGTTSSTSSAAASSSSSSTATSSTTSSTAPASTAPINSGASSVAVTGTALIAAIMMML
ncbi:hypothetical protein HDU91_005672 [Kappamyces sp. JEL0680]|nr:hypothetical protein HDU91_005672 [Kappamyces sp. JEL0680]